MQFPNLGKTKVEFEFNGEKLTWFYEELCEIPERDILETAISNFVLVMVYFQTIFW